MLFFFWNVTFLILPGTIRWPVVHLTVFIGGHQAVSDRQMKFPSGLSAATLSSCKMTMRLNAKPCYCNIREIYISPLGNSACVLPRKYISFIKIKKWLKFYLHCGWWLKTAQKSKMSSTCSKMNINFFILVVYFNSLFTSPLPKE